MKARRIAVVTGANRGIGFEIARQLAERDVHVIATGRDEAKTTSSARAIGVEHRVLDVTDRKSIEAFADSLPGGCDILVNNAGVALKGFDSEVVRRTLEVNFFGARNVTRRLLPLLRPSARIVMVSSGMGELTGVSDALRKQFEDPELTEDGLIRLIESFARDVEAGVHERHGWPSSAYRVSKIGLNALTRILARELVRDPRGILVNAACPGWVRTDMGGASAPRSPEEGAKTPVWLALDPPAGASGGFFRDERPISF